MKCSMFLYSNWINQSVSAYFINVRGAAELAYLMRLSKKNVKSKVHLLTEKMG